MYRVNTILSFFKITYNPIGCVGECGVGLGVSEHHTASCKAVDIRERG